MAECHKCPHGVAVAAGKYRRTRFERTPCAECKLRESSLQTLQVDPGRPVFVAGPQRVGTSPGQAPAGYHVDVPFPEEAEAEEAKLPVNVMQDLVTGLLALPAQLRDVVCWRFTGLDYGEIARRQGVTDGCAEKRHAKALRLFPELRQLFLRKEARRGRRERGGA